MALKKFKEVNYKQFLFDHGERIGLAVAGFVALLLALGLFWPGSGFLAPSAGANADALEKLAQNVENGMRTAQPGPADLPPPTEGKLQAFNFDVISDKTARDYMVAGVFDGRAPGSGGRQMPDVLAPKESYFALARFQMPALVYRNDYDYLLALKMGTAGGAAAGPFGPRPGGTSNGPMGSGVPPMPMGSGMGPPGGAMRGSGMGMPGMGDIGPGSQLRRTGFAQRFQQHHLVRDKLNGGDPDKGDKDYDTDWVKVENAATLGDMMLAQQAFPVRAAEIVGAFPYKDQIREFQDKLHLPSDVAVLTEPSLEADESGQPLRAFRFLGVKVQRRELGAGDKPAAGDKGQWADIDLDAAYKPLIVLSGIAGGVQQFQHDEEDDKLTPIVLPGLVLPKLPTMGDKHTPAVNPYPKEEDLLPSLKTTLDAINKPDVQVAKPSFTQVKGNIFDLGAASASQTGPNGMMPGPMGMPPSGSTPRPPGFPPSGSTPRPPGFPPSGRTPRPPGATIPAGAGMPPMGTYPGGTFPGGMFPGADQNYTVPDTCLIRLFDFTVEPGKTYEYRLQVRMANPNFGRKDAASQGYADATELPVTAWYVLPKKLVVPLDTYYYAVDQNKIDKESKDKDKDKEKEPRLPSPLIKEGQTTVQIQKWVDFLQTRNRSDLPVGDWVIAERVPATRGEPIGKQRVEVPYWRTTQARFTMYADAPVKNPKRDVASAEVAFAPEGEEPILVDFTGGDVTYARTHPKAEDAPPAAEPAVSDKAPEEVLIYTFDGKLIAHNSAKDAADPNRVQRLKDFRDWTEEVKKAKGGKEGGNSPFGPMPGNTSSN